MELDIFVNGHKWKVIYKFNKNDPYREKKTNIEILVHF